MNLIGIPNLDKSLEASLIADMAKVESLLRSHIEGEYPLVIETSKKRDTNSIILEERLKVTLVST